MKKCKYCKGSGKVKKSGQLAICNHDGTWTYEFDERLMWMVGAAEAEGDDLNELLERPDLQDFLDSLEV